MKTFAEIVEDVKPLSLPSRKLCTTCRKSLIEARRSEIREDAETGLEEYRKGKLRCFSHSQSDYRRIAPKNI